MYGAGDPGCCAAFSGEHYAASRPGHSKVSMFSLSFTGSAIDCTAGHRNPFGDVESSRVGRSAETQESPVRLSGFFVCTELPKGPVVPGSSSYGPVVASTSTLAEATAQLPWSAWMWLLTGATFVSRCTKERSSITATQGRPTRGEQDGQQSLVVYSRAENPRAFTIGLLQQGPGDPDFSGKPGPYEPGHSLILTCFCISLIERTPPEWLNALADPQSPEKPTSQPEGKGLRSARNVTNGYPR